jgi:hypothetical protein
MGKLSFLILIETKVYFCLYPLGPTFGAMMASGISTLACLFYFVLTQLMVGKKAAIEAMKILKKSKIVEGKIVA